MAILDEEPDFTRKSKGNGVLIWALSAIVFAGIIAVLWISYVPKPRIEDKESGCLEIVPSVTAVLIDVTDPLSESQQTDTLEKLEGLCAGLPQYARLDLYVLAKGLKAERLFSKCNPGVARGKTEASTNENVGKSKWKKLFRDRANTSLKTAMNKSGDDWSPIMETLNDVSGRSFSEAPGARENVLIIVSDMLQRSEMLDQYVAGRRATDFKALSAKPYFSATRPTNLGGTSVRILYLRRRAVAHLQTQAHKEFWREFFTACGASVEIKEI